MLSQERPEFHAVPADPTSIRLERAPCPRCQQEGARLLFKAPDYFHGIPGEFSVSECVSCRLWFQNPRPAPSELPRLYPSDYLPHTKPAENKSTERSTAPVFSRKHLAFFAQHLGYDHLDPKSRSLLFAPYMKRSCCVKLIPRFVPEGKLLEIGCADGRRLNELRLLGWQNLFGIELVSAAVESARAQGFDVSCGPIEDLLIAYPDATFDTVIMSMVLEHLLDPFAVVAQIAAKLKRGGEFLFSTVTRDSVDAWAYQQYWGGFDLPRHMVYFSREDLKAMLRPKFEIVEVAHQNAPQDFYRSAQWREQTKKHSYDKVVAALAQTKIGRIVGEVLAISGLTTRVSFRCRKI